MSEYSAFYLPSEDLEDRVFDVLLMGEPVNRKQLIEKFLVLKIGINGLIFKIFIVMKDWHNVV